MAKPKPRQLTIEQRTDGLDGLRELIRRAQALISRSRGRPRAADTWFLSVLAKGLRDKCGISRKKAAIATLDWYPPTQGKGRAYLARVEAGIKKLDKAGDSDPSVKNADLLLEIEKYLPLKIVRGISRENRSVPDSH